MAPEPVTIGPPGTDLVSKAVPESPACLSQKFKPRLVEFPIGRVIGEIASTPVYCRRVSSRPITLALGKPGRGPAVSDRAAGSEEPADPPLPYRKAAESLTSLHSAAGAAPPIEATSSFTPGPMVEERDTFLM